MELSQSWTWQSYNGHLATVQWIRMTFKDVDTSYAMAGAARKGDLDLLQWLHRQKRCSETCSTDAMDEAVRGGHFHVVEWIFENCSRGCSKIAVSEAAKAGDLSMLQWLHTHYSDRFDSGVMDIAAKEGHLEIVKWLHEHRSEGCTSSAMSSAAYKGHFDVVRWLHDNRTEGCTTHAMDGAAEGGHLDIVKWLHENRSEGCSDQALHNAVYYGHVDVLRWLVEHYPDQCRDDLMEDAVLAGQLDVAQYLDENTNQRASACGVGAATKQGCMKAIQALVPYYPKGSYDAVGRAFRNMLSRLSDQHVTPPSLLWTELLESLEFFHSHGYHWYVCRMLQITLERGYVALVEQFMGHRDAGEKREYVVAAATYWDIVLLRWLLENGPPINTPLAFELEYRLFAVHIEFTGYLSEGDRVQLVCKFVTWRHWRKQLLWMLEKTKFNDSSRAIISKAIKQAPSDTVQWLRENLTNAVARNLFFFSSASVNELAGLGEA